MPGFNIPFSSFCHDDDAFQEMSSYEGPTYLKETARAHRYKLEVMSGLDGLSGSGEGILLFLSKCTRPSAEIDEITIHNGQDEIYRPGKNRWRPIEFTFYEVLNDVEGPPTLNVTASKIFSLWAERAVNLQTSRIGSVNTDAAGTAYYTNAQLDMLNGVGNPVWTYDLYRCWPVKVVPKDLSYGDSAISETSVTLRFDKAFERQIT